MAKLELLSGPDAGRKYELDNGRYRIGRGEECELRWNDGSLSRQHALLTRTGTAWLLEDQDSQNGTFVDGTRVARRELTAPATLKFGNLQVRFEPRQDDAAPTVADSEDEERPATPAAASAATAKHLDRIQEMAKIYPAIEGEFGKVIVDQRQVLEQLLIAMAANGHCLMIGLPGLAKTLMVSTLGRILQLAFKRIQFTPDLMPSDITGSEILDINEASGQKSFRFVKGPVFTNLLLADEINRTPPKTQAALLESMQERQVSVASHVFPLPQPFFVLATQNPLEQEGTYPLPEAQLDRFMFNILVDYPTEAEEEKIVQATTGNRDVTVKQVLSGPDLLDVQEAVRTLPVSPHIIKYATRLVRATRPKEAGAPPFIRDYVACGAGPRAAQFLILGAKAKAVLHGRVNVSCADIRALAAPVLRHRLFTTFAADSEGMTPDTLIAKLLDAVPEPGPNDYR